MKNILLIILFIIFLLIFLGLSFFYTKRKKKSLKTKIISSSISSLKELESNPDISTDNWDLHKFRLEKFRRSQYKGLTFFVSAEKRIYYLSDKGEKVYC